MRTLRFDRGTLLLEGFPEEEVPEGFVFDRRVKMWRAPADRYREVAMALHRAKVEWTDEARGFDKLQRHRRSTRTPRSYQAEAVTAWRQHGRRGVVVLPTGAGKSFVAELCIADADRYALVVAPTLDLVSQWYEGLRQVFGEPVGIVGGGLHEVHPITVTTYDSAYLHMERFGHRFGLVVFDEVHHLPGPSVSQAAVCSLAPFRLGLTATLEREDGQHTMLERLVGPVVYQRGITELSGLYLADYTIEHIEVPLTEEEGLAYAEARETYEIFVRSRGIRTGSRGGWQHFLREAARSREGRAAFAAWRESRRLVHASEAKLAVLSELLRRHADGRALIFTSDNATVYDISRRLLVPAITHKTPMAERKALLSAFADGDIRVLATSRVLNEGVDLPSADVAIVLSGTSTVREHVQRLGRILRKKEGKQAVLYELVAAGTVELRASERRRQHEAYGQSATEN